MTSSSRNRLLLAMYKLDFLITDLVRIGSIVGLNKISIASKPMHNFRLEHHIALMWGFILLLFPLVCREKGQRQLHRSVFHLGSAPGLN